VEDDVPEEAPVLLPVGEPRPPHPHVLQQPQVVHLPVKYRRLYLGKYSHPLPPGRGKLSGDVIQAKIIKKMVFLKEKGRKTINKTGIEVKGQTKYTKRGGRGISKRSALGVNIVMLQEQEKTSYPEGRVINIFLKPQYRGLETVVTIYKSKVLIVFSENYRRLIILDNTPRIQDTFEDFLKLSCYLRRKKMHTEV
jgi:hypothetical protein